MFYPRHILRRLERALRNSPVVLLLGARQTGKTTLIKQVAAEKDYHFVTFDNLRSLAAAKEDLIGFINNIPKPVILDEIQRVPELFLPIKEAVDNDRIKNKFILTGSANPLFLPKLADSLAGRMEIITLWPLSQGELAEQMDLFIDLIFSKKMELKGQDWPGLPRNVLISKLIHGGYPIASQYQSEEDIDSWCNSYLMTMLERDVQDLSRIEGLGDFPRLLQLLATRVGGLINHSDLSRSLKIPNSTLNRYLQLLQAIFFIHLQPAWSTHLGNRLVKSKKLYIMDNAILTYLLGVDSERLGEDSRLLGMMFENFVVTELVKQSTWNRTRVKLFHFRTATGVEVDIVVENAAGEIVGIEVKSSETIQGSDFNGLKHLQSIAGEKFLRGFVVYPGDQFLPFGENLFAMPVTALYMHHSAVVA